MLEVAVPDEYNKAKIQDIVRAICQQLNLLSEGKVQARYQAQASVPGSSVAGQISDVVWDNNATVRNGTVGGAGGPVLNYVRLGWIVNVSDPVNPTWQEMRIPTA